MAMQIKRFIVGLVLLAVTAGGAYGTFVLVVAWAQSLNPTVAGAFVTAFLGLAGLWYVQWQSKSRDIAESHRPSKIEIYNTFFSLVERFQNESVEVKEGEVPDWLKTEFTKLNRGLIVWASPEVIKAWLAFRTTTQSGGNVLVAVDRMYQAIRKDLGNSNFGLQPGDLMKIGLKDPTEWKS